MENIWVIIALNTLFNSNFATKENLPEDYASLPIPCIERGGVVVKVAHFSQSGPIAGKPQILYNQVIVSSISYPDMDINYDKINSEALGIESTNGEIGVIDRSKITSIDAYLEAKKTYQVLLTKVLEKRWLIREEGNLQEKVDTASELKEAWDLLAEDKIMPFYLKEGDRFMEWIKQYARRK